MASNNTANGISPANIHGCTWYIISIGLLSPTINLINLNQIKLPIFYLPISLRCITNWANVHRRPPKIEALKTNKKPSNWNWVDLYVNINNPKEINITIIIKENLCNNVWMLINGNDLINCLNLFLQSKEYSKSQNKYNTSWLSHSIKWNGNEFKWPIRKANVQCTGNTYWSHFSDINMPTQGNSWNACYISINKTQPWWKYKFDNQVTNNNSQWIMESLIK